jgi:hypothetical protein
MTTMCFHWWGLRMDYLYMTIFAFFNFCFFTCPNRYTGAAPKVPCGLVYKAACRSLEPRKRPRGVDTGMETPASSKLMASTLLSSPTVAHTTSTSWVHLQIAISAGVCRPATINPAPWAFLG